VLARVQVTRDWERYTAKIEADEAIKKELGWVGGFPARAESLCGTAPLHA
jgi:hypothetical protein